MWILRIKNSFMFLSGCSCELEETQFFFLPLGLKVSCIVVKLPNVKMISGVTFTQTAPQLQPGDSDA